MTRRLLLTSFTIWKPHHITNSSDDLLLDIQANSSSAALHFLRLLPVDFELAPQQAIAKFEELQPDGIVCCGMAETRSHLSVETRAVLRNQTLMSTVDLEQLIAGLRLTQISEDAGQFVCNTLYYEMLNYLQERRSPALCLFVHVPVLTAENRESIVHDFKQILHRLQTLTCSVK